MRPIRFECEASLPYEPEEIARLILDLSLWPNFGSYGILPGIRSATFERQTPDVVGTRIRVVNTDGSTHTEEIEEWAPGERIRLRLASFSPPLSRLAPCFIETWEFLPSRSGSRVARKFELIPRSVLARPALWLISVLLKRAIQRHLRLIKESRSTATA